jgi:hypothetical protein
MVEITNILKEELKYDSATRQDRLPISTCERKPKISALRCDNCSQLDNQLKVTLNELSSVKLIIEILNEEIKIWKQTFHINLNPGTTWSTAKSSNPRSPTTVRQPKEVHGISIHCMPTTSNRFEMLSDLSEDGNRFKPAKEPCGYPRRQQRKSDCKEATPRRNYCSGTEITQHAFTKHDNATNGNLKNSTRKIPVVINGQTPLSASTSINRKKHDSSFQQNKDHKIIIIGDSHARGASSNLQHNLDTIFGPSGFVNPGANVNSPISSVTSDIKHLRSKDVMVLWG